jgi:hypothetical protein
MDNPEYIDKCFDNILALEGVEELKATVQRLQKFHKNKEKYSITDVALPNYLWIANRGGGISTCVNAFSEYLDAAKLFPFTGNVKYFEFIPAYIEPNAYFSELTRFNNTISDIAGHHSHFRGVACIIIDEWIEHVNEKNFYKLLDYLENKTDKILSIFCVHTNNKRIIGEIEASLSSYLRFETINLRFLSPDELISFIDNKYLYSYNFRFTKEAKALLLESINEIVSGKNFNGFVTIKQLANDIMYNLLTSNINNNEITVDLLSNFDKKSSYVKRLKKLFGNDSIVGFTQNEE